MLPRGKAGRYGPVGPGLTEDVDESALTTNALWEVVTGTSKTQDWHDGPPARSAGRPVSAGRWRG